jgi:hypothetical protein
MIFRVRRPLIDGAMVVCASCNLRAATHWIDKRGKRYYLCCECYVATGAVPAVWHPACVGAYAQKFPNKNR